MTATDLELAPVKMTDPKLVLALMFAGDSTLTFRSVQSGTRYTYRIQEGTLRDEDKARGRTKAPFFVNMLTGQDNENDFTYLGMITPDNKTGVMGFRTTSKTKNPNSQPVKGFEWALNILIQGRIPQGLEIYPSTHCARCNRKLSDPEQPGYKEGFGPICFELIGGAAGIMAFASSFIQTPTPSPAASITPGRPPVGTTDYRVSHPVVTSKPSTPKAIVAAVNDDPNIKKMADEMWAKNPANPINKKPEPIEPPVPAGDVRCSSCHELASQASTVQYPEATGEFCPACQKTAEALAKSQDGWTVGEAAYALTRRKTISLNLTKAAVSKAVAAVAASQEGQAGMTPLVATEATYSPLRAQIEDQVPLQLLAGTDPEILAKVAELRDADGETFTMDGIMNDAEATAFWYRRFVNDSTPVEV